MTGPNRAQRRAAQKPHSAFEAQRQYRNDVAIGYLHRGDSTNPAFATSLLMLQAFDLRGAVTPEGKKLGGQGRFGFHLPLESGANIVGGRNKLVREFLTHTTAEWLWMVDDDMVFDADTLDRLLDDADKDTKPIVGGLCFARLRAESQQIVPTCYSLNAQGQMSRWNGYPEEQVFEVDATGAACMLVHRSVFETILNATVGEEIADVAGVSADTPRYPPPWPWFAETVTGADWGDSMSEDLTFCMRAKLCGFPIHVDSRIKIGHVKSFEIDEPMYRMYLPQAELPAPTFVVIPVKGKFEEFTGPILKALDEQGGFERCFVYDNDAQIGDCLGFPIYDWLDVLPAKGKNIHEMWNLGIKKALAAVSDGRCNIAILNNDLELGENFLEELGNGLRAHPSIAAVCANYDNRPMMEKVGAVKGIAAGREDGTGGFAGFAMMFRGELFAAGCPLFDEELQFWYGDNAMLMQLDKANATYGIARDAHVKHIGGGSQTSGDGKGARLTPELAAIVEQDRAIFERKYLGLVPA